MKRHNKSSKFTPFSTLIPQDGDKTRRPLARRLDMSWGKSTFRRGLLILSMVISLALIFVPDNLDPIGYIDYIEYENGFAKHIMGPKSLSVKQSRKRRK